MDVDPGPSYFKDFAEIVRHFRPERDAVDEVEVLLNQEDGLAAQFEKLCGQYFRDASRDMMEEERQAWRLESDTWLLVKALYMHRLIRTEKITVEELLQVNPYTTPSELAGAILSSDQLTELNLVKIWLGASAPEAEGLKYRKGYWPNTTMRENQRSRVGGTKGLGLDPDGPLRGLVMEGDDAALDRDLMRQVFQCIRANNAERALEICQEAAQPWRAASLLGGRPYTTFALSNNKAAGMEPSGGNRHRMLWKRTCLKLARTPSLDVYERAVYGAQVGDVKTIREVCRTWEDHLWARVHSRLEQAVDAGLLESDSWWMKKGGIANNTPLEGVERVTENLDLIFDEISREQTVGDEALHPFRLAQKHIILKAVEELLRSFDEKLAERTMPDSDELRNQLVCFFAHLVLFLRWTKAVSVDMRPTESNILKEYCDILERMDEPELVALYAGLLGETHDRSISNGATIYAKFLQRMNLAPTETRAEALRRTTQNGLDIVEVATKTVALVFAELLPSSTGFDDPEPSFTALDQELSYDEGSLINAVDWLLFDRSTYEHALTRANALLRYFLLNGCLHAARQLVKRLPQDINQGDRDLSVHNESTEQWQLRTFMACVDALEKCRDFENGSNVARSRLAKLDRQRAYSTAMQQARDETVTLLQSDWLRALPDDPALPERPRQIERLRKLYIPELVMRLHDALYQAKDEVPEALQWTYDLANIVADGRYGLADEFLTAHRESNKLKTYLNEVRKVGLTVLKRGGTDPFAIVSR